ncbi:hypothetical protein P3W45_001429 [Vairimorpha bombi]|jgi:hypothetical protein
MNLSIILEIKKANIIRYIKKTIEKLFLLEKQNKIFDMDDKLEKLKDMINRKIDEIQAIDRLINLRNKYDPLIFYITEFLNVNMCYKSSKMLSTKYNQESDILFYQEISNIMKEYWAFNYDPVLNFLKEYRNIFKTLDIENEIKLEYFWYLCMNKMDKECLRFVKKNELCRKYLINIIKLKNSFKQIEKLEDILLEGFGICNSRIQKKIEYGMISFKTRICYKYPRDVCPSCVFVGLRSEVPFNRKEHSVILCRGSHEVISEENRAVCYSNGHVYGENYVKKNAFKIEDGKYPRVCYFM